MRGERVDGDENAGISLRHAKPCTSVRAAPEDDEVLLRGISRPRELVAWQVQHCQ